MKSSDATIVIALRELAANGIKSEDGIANAAIAEAADRLEAVSDSLTLFQMKLMENEEQLGFGLTNRQLKCVLGLLESLDERVLSDNDIPY